MSECHTKIICGHCSHCHDRIGKTLSQFEDLEAMPTALRIAFGSYRMWWCDRYNILVSAHEDHCREFKRSNVWIS